ncbi:MAG TPA: DNA-binding transcriptional regulator [Tepidisphaeraceae bacterium]|jgi:LacI family transcriptional regulator|nr:DNA-binding transcriptional regulator [Tepidisphaeraceae bacterium]
MAKPLVHIAVLTDHVGTYGRQVLEGIARYATVAGNWKLILRPEFVLLQQFQESDWTWNGMIVQAFERSLAKEVAARGVAAVNISTIMPDPPLPSVLVDHAAVAQMAVRDLVERGFRELAYVGFNAPYSAAREAAFVEAAHQGGRTAHVWVSPTPDPDEAVLGQWLAQLPKPVGILGCNDQHAAHVVTAATRAGVAVPEQAAVLGVDNDELVNRMLRPTLSSIAVAGERIGYEAAALLDQVIQGKVERSPALPPVIIAPVGVVTRQSTDVLAIADADVAAAVRFIREHAGDPIRVDDVLREVPASRRSLELRFRRVLGRSPLDEIVRVHVERAKHLLAETELPMPRVAVACGFRDASYMGVVFRKLTGQTPTSYRQLFRLGGGNR